MVEDFQYLVDKTGIPNGLAATLMCSGLTAFSAIKKMGPLSKEGAKDILIIGAGGLGMQCFEMIKALFGVSPMIADISQSKLEQQPLRGARIFNMTDDDIAKQVIQASSGGTGIIGVIDFVGASETFMLSNSVLRKGGRVAQVGLLGGVMKMPLNFFPLRALSIIGVYVGTLDECREMFALVRKGKISPIQLDMRSIRSINDGIHDLKAGNISGRCVFKHDWDQGKI